MKTSPAVPRANANFFNAIKLICPTGTGAEIVSSPSRENISLSPSGKSGALVRMSCPERGALRNVINAGRDAMDADALLTNSARRGRRSRVVLTPRRWRQVSREVFREATVAKEPGHRGEHEGNR